MGWSEIIAIIMEIIQRCLPQAGRERTRQQLLVPDHGGGRWVFENAVRKKLGIRIMQWRRGERDRVMDEIYAKYGSQLSEVAIDDLLEAAEESTS